MIYDHVHEWVLIPKAKIFMFPYHQINTERGVTICPFHMIITGEMLSTLPNSQNMKCQPSFTECSSFPSSPPHVIWTSPFLISCHGIAFTGSLSSSSPSESCSVRGLSDHTLAFICRDQAHMRSTAILSMVSTRFSRRPIKALCEPGHSQSGDGPECMSRGGRREWRNSERGRMGESGGEGRTAMGT